jgi:hypothetical protein
MRNADLIELFDLTPTGTLVEIDEGEGPCGPGEGARPLDRTL